jgi:hypothetical protein
MLQVQHEQDLVLQRDKLQMHAVIQFVTGNHVAELKLNVAAAAAAAAYLECDVQHGVQQRVEATQQCAAHNTNSSRQQHMAASCQCCLHTEYYSAMSNRVQMLL